MTQNTELVKVSVPASFGAQVALVFGGTRHVYGVSAGKIAVGAADLDTVLRHLGGAHLAEQQGIAPPIPDAPTPPAPSPEPDSKPGS